MFYCRNIFLVSRMIPFSVAIVMNVARLLALGLVAFWLPISLHCQLASLETCDEGASCLAHHCGCSGAGKCQSGVCKIIESGNYHVKRVSLLVSAVFPVWITEAVPANFSRLLTSVIVLGESTGAPPGWNCGWQFLFRAASAPRAPSVVC